MDNVFIGSNTTIMYDVKIGSNIIIGANSLVNRDLETGYVYAGTPVKKICSYQEYFDKRKGKQFVSIEKSQHLSAEEIKLNWCNFYARRKIDG